MRTTAISNDNLGACQVGDRGFLFSSFFCWRQLPLLIPSLLAGPDLLVPKEYWLPSEVILIPVHYDLKLVVHMSNLTTRRKVSVQVQVVKATFNITLHANSTLWQTSRGTWWPITRTTFNWNRRRTIQKRPPPFWWLSKHGTRSQVKSVGKILSA